MMGVWVGALGAWLGAKKGWLAGRAYFGVGYTMYAFKTLFILLF